MRDYDFNSVDGPSTRQKWQAFWTMYRMTREDMQGLSTEWQVLLWHGPLYKWYCVAEYGNCNGSSGDCCWELYRMRMRFAKTSEKQQILKEIRNRTGQNQNPSVTSSQ